MALRPNVLIILADDMGYSDLGCFGGEIRTPHLDRLAEEGLRFSDYQDVVSLPELLQEANYSTMISGKWHIGYQRGQIPCDRGFQRCFSMLCGSQNHFGWRPDYKDSAPAKNSQANAPIYIQGDRRWLPEPNVNEDPSGYYSSDHFADTLIDFLKESVEERKDEGKPFFAYLPFSAPHTPIQCLKSDRDHYEGVYDAGPDKLREQRLKRMVKLGLVSPDVISHPVTTKHLPWDDLSPEDQKKNAREYQCYAGMVEALDRAAGRVLDYLRETKELDNTLVLAFSDNGPAAMMGAPAEVQTDEIKDMLGSDIQGAIKKYYDNSFENLGSFNSFPQPGDRWAQAASAPMRLFKGQTTEGGIRVPMIVRFPPFTKRQPPGSITHAFSTVMDIMPTVLSLAGVSHPNPNPSCPTSKAPWKSQQVYPMRGRDWTPYFIEGKVADPFEESIALATQTQELVGRQKLFITPFEDQAIWGRESPAVGWEIHGRAAVRRGKWKILNIPDADGYGVWRLYDMETDQGETIDLAAQFPEKLQEMLTHWRQYCEETGAFLPQEEAEMKPNVKTSGPLRPGQDRWLQVPIGETLPHNGS